MKTKKKTNIEDNLDSVIAKGAANVENPEQKNKRGRPKLKVPKKQCNFYLPKPLIVAIEENCGGNKSVWAEKVFTEYLALKNIVI